MKPAVPPQRRSKQGGVAAVEFAMGALIFFSMLFGLMELSRAFYLWSTMVETTRRASRDAAFTAFDSAAQLAVRRKAIFSDLPGGLPLAGGLNHDNLVIDYLNHDMQVVGAPACPEQNLVNCAVDPNGGACIRFVRVRLCANGGPGCTRVPYVPMIGGIVFPNGSLKFPTFVALSPVASFGHAPGDLSTCP